MGERMARWLPRAVVGFGTAAVALAAGEVAAAFVRPEAAPIIAIGNRFVTLTPEWLKAFATRDLGTSDKTVLIMGIYAVIALLALPLGWLAERNLRLGVVAVATFGALAMYSSLTTAAPKAGDVIPSAVATVAGVTAVIMLQRAAARWTAGAATDRRAFLLAAAGVAGAVLVGEFAGRAWQRSRFSAAPSRAAVKLPTPATPAPPLPAGVQLDAATPFDTPNRDFYRVDIALRVPQIDADSWRLRIDGMVDLQMTLTFAQLLARPMIERWITIACVSNYVGGDLISTSRFLGTPLAPLLREAGVHSAADQLLAHGKDGATIGVPTAAVFDGRDAMLAVGYEQRAAPARARLSRPHGGARLVRLRFGVQVDRPDHCHHVQRAGRVLGGPRLGPRGADPAGVAHRRAPARRARQGRRHDHHRGTGLAPACGHRRRRGQDRRRAVDQCQARVGPQPGHLAAVVVALEGGRHWAAHLHRPGSRHGRSVAGRCASGPLPERRHRLGLAHHRRALTAPAATLIGNGFHFE
jgi:DMSO/TMAO reductase YedYZ molybdopterin-dependent catalytic subunit